jgi:hypothetical protein
MKRILLLLMAPCFALKLVTVSNNQAIKDLNRKATDQPGDKALRQLMSSISSHQNPLNI